MASEYINADINELATFKKNKKSETTEMLSEFANEDESDTSSFHKE